MALYNCIYDTKQTQLGFSLHYFPLSALSPSVRRWIRFTQQINTTKRHIKKLCNDTSTHLIVFNESWEIVWRNNATPTELEWSMWTDDQEIEIEFRHTSLHGHVAILSRGKCNVQNEFVDSELN